jgi:hypothetical protein
MRPQTSDSGIPVFLSYSRKDFFFSELASAMLKSAGIRLWRDTKGLVAGRDWRQGIEEEIGKSKAVIVALSPNSSESAYVTYEWAYALGKGIPVIPVLIEPCGLVHPRLASVQHLDFTNHSSLPWDDLAERIQEIELEEVPSDEPAIEVRPVKVRGGSAAVQPASSDPKDAGSSVTISPKPEPTESGVDWHVVAILKYLDQRGYRLVSFDRIRKRIDPELTDDMLGEIVTKNPTLFRFATLKGGVRGIAKLGN